MDCCVCPFNSRVVDILAGEQNLLELYKNVNRKNANI